MAKGCACIICDQWDWCDACRRIKARLADPAERGVMARQVLDTPFARLGMYEISRRNIERMAELSSAKPDGDVSREPLPWWKSHG